MNYINSDENSAETVISEIERIKEQKPSSANIIEAFRYLLIEQANIKAQTQLPQIPDSFKVDPIRFSQGIGVLMQENFGHGHLIQADDYLQNYTERLFRAMEKGFPKIASELNSIKNAIQNGQFYPARMVEAMLKQEENTIIQTISDISNQLNATDSKSSSNATNDTISNRTDTISSSNATIPPELLAFVTLQIMKPFMAKFAESAASLIEGLEWNKGNCPICGAYPEISFLKTDVGQRWLRCSICSHSWRFIRIQCPVCENSEPDKSEAIFVEDLPHERAELCDLCKRYIVTVDLRKNTIQSVSDTTVFGMLHLDMLAQEKGYSPMSILAWNFMK